MDHPEEETKPTTPEFDFSAFPVDTLFYDRREGRGRRKTDQIRPEDAGPPKPRPERRARKERRRRIDPTTFEKQYTDDEMEFMTAMQRFKVQSGKTFPSHGDVLRVAVALGYRRFVEDGDDRFSDDGTGATLPGPENDHETN